MKTVSANFNVGQIVHHKLFDYRGVIIDVDPEFQQAEEWYETMSVDKPPKDKPWYYILVDNSVHTTYVTEENLEADPTGDPVNHPDLDDYFDNFKDGNYVAYNSIN